MAIAVPIGAQCIQCRYALQGLMVPRCPECGQEFDPADLYTMRVPGRPALWALPLLKPFGPTTNILALVGTLLILWDAVPGHGPFLVIGQLIWIAVTARWLTRVLFRMALAIYYRLGDDDLPGGWRRFAFAPCCFAVLFFLIFTGWSVYPRFILSYPFLRYTASTIAPQELRENSLAGLYSFQYIVNNGDGVRFRLNGPTGFLFARPDFKPTDDLYEIHWLGGSWYLIVDPESAQVLKLKGLFKLGGLLS